jgi:hypothetical protein
MTKNRSDLLEMLRTVDRVVGQIPALEEMVLRRDDRTTLKEHLAQLHDLRRHASKLGSVTGYAMSDVFPGDVVQLFVSAESEK